MINNFSKYKIWDPPVINEFADIKRVIFLIEMIQKLRLREDFKLVDICCGNGIVMDLIGLVFPKSKCTGIDIFEYPYHSNLRYSKIIYMPLQEFLAKDEKYDIALMLNTYRFWGANEEYNNIKNLFDNWLEKNCLYFIGSNLEKFSVPYQKKYIFGNDIAGALEMIDFGKND